MNKISNSKSLGKLLYAEPGRESEIVEPEYGDKFELSELQQMVGGYIEIVSLGVLDDSGKRSCLIINEEGKLQNLPINIAATALYQMTHPSSDCIVGNALLIYLDNID